MPLLLQEHKAFIKRCKRYSPGFTFLTLNLCRCCLRSGSRQVHYPSAQYLYLYWNQEEKPRVEDAKIKSSFTTGKEDHQHQTTGRWGLASILLTLSEKRSCCQPDQRLHWFLYGNVYNGREDRCRKSRQSSKLSRRYLMTQRQALSKAFSWDNTVTSKGFGMDGDQWADLQRQDWSELGYVWSPH